MIYGYSNNSRGLYRSSWWCGNTVALPALYLRTSSRKTEHLCPVGSARPPIFGILGHHPQPCMTTRWTTAWEMEFCILSKLTYLRGLATPSWLPREGQQHPLKQLVGFLVVLGDVSILMEAKDFWVGCDGQVPKILDIGLERKCSVDTNPGPLES